MTDNSENQTIQIGIPLNGNSELLFGGSMIQGDDLEAVNSLQSKGGLKFTSNKTANKQSNITQTKSLVAIGPFIDEVPINPSSSKHKKANKKSNNNNLFLIDGQFSELKDTILDIKDFLKEKLEPSIKKVVDECFRERDQKIKEAKQTINLTNDSNIELKPKDASIDIENIASYKFQYTGATFYDDFIVLALDASQFTVDLKNANLTLELASYPDEKFQGVFLGKPFKPFPDVPYSLLVFLKAPTVTEEEE